MRLRILLVVGLMLMATPVWSQSALQSECAEVGGRLVNQLVCPQSGKKRKGLFCVAQAKPLVFFNGCTGGFGKYRDIFFGPCMEHDLCYHHEPATNGLSKRQCDADFYEDLLDTCRKQKSSRIRCNAVAKIYYQSVRWLGTSSWKCSDSVFTGLNSEVPLPF